MVENDLRKIELNSIAFNHILEKDEDSFTNEKQRNNKSEIKLNYFSVCSEINIKRIFLFLKL
jgi:hypothetical protein